MFGLVAGGGILRGVDPHGGHMGLVVSTCATTYSWKYLLGRIREQEVPDI